MRDPLALAARRVMAAAALVAAHAAPRPVCASAPGGASLAQPSLPAAYPAAHSERCVAGAFYLCGGSGGTPHGAYSVLASREVAQ